MGEVYLEILELSFNSLHQNYLVRMCEGIQQFDDELSMHEKEGAIRVTPNIGVWTKQFGFLNLGKEYTLFKIDQNGQSPELVDLYAQAYFESNILFDHGLGIDNVLRENWVNAKEIDWVLRGIDIALAKHEVKVHGAALVKLASYGTDLKSCRSLYDPAQFDFAFGLLEDYGLFQH